MINFLFIVALSLATLSGAIVLIAGVALFVHVPSRKTGVVILTLGAINAAASLAVALLLDFILGGRVSGETYFLFGAAGFAFAGGLSGAVAGMLPLLKLPARWADRKR